MKQKLFSFFLAVLGMIVGVTQAKASDNVSCSGYLSATAGSPNVSNCSLVYYSQEGQLGNVPAGTAIGTYYYAKINNNANYYQVTLSCAVGSETYSKFKAGDEITVYLYSNGSTVSYFVGNTARTEVTLSDQTTGQIIQVPHTLTAAEIESDGTLRIYRNSSNTYFAGISITGTREQTNQAASDFTITSSASPIVAIGNTSSITYTSSSDGVVTYNSDNTNVATVNSNGTITAVSGGVATITITQAETTTYEGATTSIKVYVPYATTQADSYKIDKSTYAFSDASNNYYFTNGFIISNNGNKGWGTGSYTNSMKFSANTTYTITIPEGVSIVRAKLTARNNYGNDGAAAAYWGELFGTVYDGEEDQLPWSNEDPTTKIITFGTPQTGTLTIKPSGNQVQMLVELEANDTRQASDLTLTSSNAVSLDANTTTSQITATTSATVGLTYTSSNPTVATVSSTGLITAVANGTATITVAQVGDATYMDDSKTVTVTVNNGVSASYSIAAQINNQSGTMLTSAETAAQGNAVSFGINAAGERVAADAADAVVTISGNYHNDHGVTNLVATVKATGNMMITIGNCQYNNGTITVSKGGQTIISESLSNTACWKNNHSDVTQVLYEGEAATLTVSVPSYCPYFAVESVAEVTKYTVTFMNGNETVDTKQVAEGTALGTLPTPTYDTDTQCFLGWYSDTDDLGTKAYTSTVPTGNTTLYAIIIDKPTEAAGYYVVNNGRELMAMIDYANANANANTPVKVFLKNGTYDFGSSAETTQLTGSYISLIGESLDGTVITNIPEHEGLADATLLYNKGSYNYLQDLTLHNNYPYGNSTGRAPSLKDEGNYTICKNVWLYSHQDTYYSHTTGGYFYFNGGKISGCVDYMCGQSRVYYDGVTLSNDNRDTYMTANSELYVFNNCIVENNGSNTYYFGRSWGSVNGGPHCIFINTTLKDNGSHLANTRWVEAAMNNLYVTAGEYGTKNADGTDITPSSNIVNFTHDSGNISLETILTAEQAATYTMAYTLGDWAATAQADAEQAEVSNVVLNGNTLTWDGSSDAYLIEKGGEFVALTSESSYTVEDDATYTVRAANGRGGFGEAVENTAAAHLILTTTQNMAGYKSFYDADKSYTLDENTTAYIAIQKKDNLIGLRKIAVVPANTPVILKTTGVAAEPRSDAAYYQMTLTASDDELAVNTGGNLLAVTAGAGENLNVYRLGYKAGEDYGVGFYTWTVTGNTTAGIVYININNDGGTNAKLGFTFEDEEEETPTAINSISEDNTETEDAAYNMAGQRINPTAKGLVIKRNGKFINQ